MKIKKRVIILTLMIFNMFGLFGQSNEKLDFTKEYFKILKQNIENIELISLKELEIKTKIEDNEHTHFLDNAYNEYSGNEEIKSEVIDRYIKSSLENYKPKPIFSLDQVVPVIKTQAYIDELLRITGKEEVNTFYEVYNRELYIFYARDLENSISYITKDKAEELNLEISNIRELSTENLLNRVSIKKHDENGFFMLTAGGNYEASLILANTIWTKENFDVNGEIIISIPSRDVILITGSENANGIETLRNKTNEIYNSGSYVISNELFVLRNGKFELWNE